MSFRLLRPGVRGLLLTALAAFGVAASAAIARQDTNVGLPPVVPSAFAVPDSDLRLLFTGSIEGHLEACGCTIGRFGGLDRLTAALEELGLGGPTALHIDCGDLLATNTDVPRVLVPQMPLKAEALIAVLAGNGCAALAVGDGDLVLPVEALLAIGERHGLPLLCANLVDAENRPVFQRVEIVERAGLRIAIFGLLAQNLVQPDLDDDSTIKVGEIVEAQGLRLLPWRTAARDLVANLEGRVDMIVCASHLGHQANLELAELCPRIDVICGPHFKGIEQPHTVVGSTIVTFVHRKAANVTCVERWWAGAPPTLTQRPAVGDDVTTRVDGLRRRAIAIAGLRNLLGREAIFGPVEHDRRTQAFEASIAEVDAYLAQAGPFPSTVAFAVTSPNVHRNLERREEVLVALDDYHGALDAFWNARSGRDKAADSPFVDPARCAQCHPDQYEFWKSTDHARAYSTLAITNQHNDAECFGCHTVGFGEKGGFAHPGEAVGFENVQCAACHGPGAGHLAGGIEYLGGRHLTKVGSTCVQCHDESHDSDFFSLVKRLPDTTALVQEKVVKVACPKMPGPGLGNDAFKAALAEAGDALRAQESVEWAEVVRVYQRAGERPAAIAAAERFVETSKGAPLALRTHGMLLFDDGQTAAARELLERALPQLGDDAEVELLLARAWLPDDPQRALYHAREAHSLLPDLPDMAAAVALALSASGDRDGALTFLEQHVARFANHAPVLASLIEELR